MSDAARRLDALAPSAEPQCGLLSRQQLNNLGVTSSTVRDHVAAGRWTVLSRRVVALQSGPLSEAQAAWFAVLDGGDGCLLAGLSSLHYQGLSEQARHPVRRPPMMRVPVALVDSLENTSLPLRGCALLAAVVQQRLLRAVDLRPMIARAGTLPHRASYLAVAGDIEGGAHSLTEVDFHRLAHFAGLPAPAGQAVRIDRYGRRRYLDVDFGGFAVEVDGAVHLRPLTWWDDTWRLNEIIIDGKPTLRFPSVGIYLRPDRVIDQLRRARDRWL